MSKNLMSPARVRADPWPPIVASWLRSAPHSILQESAAFTTETAVVGAHERDDLVILQESAPFHGADF